MGLFDSALYNPSYYNGSGGLLTGLNLPQSQGFDDSQQQSPLLDWLRAQFAKNGGYASGAVSDPAAAMMQPNTIAFPTQGTPPITFANIMPGQVPNGAQPLPAPTNVPELKVASVPQPEETQLPQGARPAGPAIAQAPQQPAPDLFPQQDNGGLGAGFRGFLANAHTGPLGAILGGVAGLAGMGQGNTQQKMAQALYSALVPRVGQQQALAIAQAASSDPKLAEVLLPQALGLKPPATIEGVIAERLSRPGLGGQGQTTVDPYREIQKLEAAKAAGSAGGKVEGERVATAQIDLPATVAKAQEAMRLAESLRSHPGRDNQLFFHGALANYLPDSAIPGNSDAFDANQRLFQLKSGAFAEAYASLKGGGQISNVEGEKMTSALNRMNRAQSRKEFDAALNDFEGILRLGIDRANQQAGRKAPYGFQGNQGQGVANGVGWRIVK